MRVGSCRSCLRGALLIGGLASGVLAFDGCATVVVDGVRLLHPELYATVDTLQPEFRWQPAAGSSYDFAIWKLRE